METQVVAISISIGACIVCVVCITAVLVVVVIVRHLVIHRKPSGTGIYLIGVVWCVYVCTMNYPQLQWQCMMR